MKDQAIAIELIKSMKVQFMKMESQKP